MIRSSVDDWKALSALYEKADALSEDARDAWLADLQAAGHRLLPTLRRMLDARRAVKRDGFLEQLPKVAATSDAIVVDWGEGSRVGPWRLKSHLGSGGMAEVWLAERADGAFSRQVAVKLLFNHPSRAQRDSFIERFRRERDILASLAHPNIAALHDAGVTADGQPWLALDYVEGLPITEWCDSNRLSVPERLGVFRQALLAVEHAHANLVIHRDLKPSNILVSASGDVKLLDFGIAKLVEAGVGEVGDSELTRAGGRPLTLQYASPEQVQGKAMSTAVDIYAMGLILYELLAGLRPYEIAGASPAMVERLIVEVDPPPPSRRRDCGPRSVDLDAIVLKALQKIAAQRYTSIEALRGDLDRWRQGEVVTARRSTLLYRVERFVARNRLGVVIGGAVATAICVSAAVAIVAAIEARRESDRAIAAREFLVSIYRSADPEQSPGGSVDAKRMLEAGSRRAVSTLSRQPELQAQVLAGIGAMQTNIDDYAGADVSLLDAKRILESLGDRRARAHVEAGIAANAFQKGELESARTHIDVAVKDAADFKSDRALQIKVLTVSGRVRSWLGETERGRGDLTAGYDLARAHLPTDDTRTIDLLRDLSLLEMQARQFSTARAHLEEAERRVSASADSRTRERIGVRFELAMLEYLMGRFRAAEALLGNLSPACERELGKETQDCLGIRLLRANVALRSGNREVASALLPSLLRKVEDGASPRRQAESLIVGARLLLAQDRLAECELLQPQLKAIAEGRQSESHRSAAWLAMAEANLLASRLGEAQTLIARALSVQSASASPSDAFVARARLMEAIVLQRAHRHDLALDAFEHSIRSMMRVFGSSHPNVLLARISEVPSLHAAGRGAQGRQVCDESMTALRTALGDDSSVPQAASRACEMLSKDSAARHEGFVPPYFFL